MSEEKLFYTPDEIASLDYNRDIGYPGEPPFTRGIYPTMYRGKEWTIRQYSGFGSAEETNDRFKFLLSQGQTGLSVAFDLATQNGYDSDHDMARGEVGKVGVAINSLADMEVMFDEIPLDEVSTSMTINAPASILTAMYVAVAKKQGVDLDKITGTAQNDILKEYVARGTYIFPPEPSVRLAANLINYCAENVPRFNAISVSGYHIRDAGSTAAQEVAFSFENAFEYLKECVRQGLDIDQVAPRVSWIFNTQNNFLEEVSKYRALRRVWSEEMLERFEAKDERSLQARIHVQTGGATLTAQQPEVNIVRAALQALATVYGGTQSLALSCYDEALAIPTEKAQQIAVRTQQIIAYESGAADTIDPFAGSYYVEFMTNKIEQEVREYLRKIDEMGGAVRAIENGYMSSEIDEASYSKQRAVDLGEKIVVGVNKFQTEEDAPAIFKVEDVKSKQKVLERLNKVRRKRNQKVVDKNLDRIKEEASDDVNLMPAIIDAVESYATVGEISDSLKEVWGTYSPSGL